MDRDVRARSPWVGVSAVAVGTFMSTLDGSIVNVALPTIAGEVGAGVDRVQWIVAGYLLTISAALLAAGRLGDLAGHRRVFVGGLLLFTGGSVLCGVAPGLWPLVAARVVQAVGASATMAIGPAALTALFPAHQRGRALGAVGSVVALGLTVGPPLGGLVVQHLSWRWLFYVNLPIGIAGAFWARATLPASPGDPDATFDGGGAAVLALAVAAGVAAIQVAPSSAVRALVLAGATAALLAALVRVERRAPSPLVDGRLFANRVFTFGLLSGFLSYAALFSNTLLMPFYLAQVKGLPPRALGLVLTAVPLALSVVSPAAGRLSDRLGSRGLCAAGMALLAGGLGALSLARGGDGVPSIAARLAVCGVGMGLFQPPNNSAVMGSLPRERLGSGGGLLAEARNLGMVAGISLSEALLRVASGGREDPASFLRGYGAALSAGAALAAVAGIASLVRGRAAPSSATFPVPPSRG